MFGIMTESYGGLREGSGVVIESYGSDWYRIGNIYVPCDYVKLLN